MAGMAKLVIFALLISIVGACGANQRILESANETANAARTPAITIPPKLSSFEEDLQAMRNADFNFIYVLRRKDGAALDRDDKRFVAGVTPTEINRRRVADNSEWIILGSNFRLPEDVSKLLRGRFDFEDHSKPESEIMSGDQNTNTNA